jgi:hypothetical protein
MQKPMSDDQACNRVPDETVISSNPRATFVSSLQRGTEKSRVFSLVYRGQMDDSVLERKL